MAFKSLIFPIFFVLVFVLYWFPLKGKIRAQNFFLLLASYVFYGWWDWRFLSLIIFSSLVDYTIGLKMNESSDQKTRKRLLFVSLFVNLGMLGVFKYFNFFSDSFATLMTQVGLNVNPLSLNVILPAGISFYTFQTLSYTIDIYRRQLEPTKDMLQFFTFVSFFPQLVAGPIERAKNLLPQFAVNRRFSYEKAVDGSRQILWGFFQKIVIADNCAVYANEIFNNSADYGGSTLLLGAIFFTFQIYGDFSGYSNIAIGTARLFGVNLMQNFAFPYFSRDIAEFWRRWHISLSTWFRDYVYIPLGGSRIGTWGKVRNTFVIFIVSGFWHGANWTFIIWGALNALYILPLILLKQNRNNLDIVAKNRYLPNLRECWQMGITFLLTVLAWVFFRADNVTHAVTIIGEIFSFSSLSKPAFVGMYKSIFTLGLIGVFLIIEWLGREGQFALDFSKVKLNRPVRWASYYLIILSILYFGNFEDQPFIYFQF